MTDTEGRHRRTQGQDSHLLTKGRGLRKIQPCQHLDLELLASRTVRISLYGWNSPACDTWLWWPNQTNTFPVLQLMVLDLERIFYYNSLYQNHWHFTSSPFPAASFTIHPCFPPLPEALLTFTFHTLTHSTQSPGESCTVLVLSYLFGEFSLLLQNSAQKHDLWVDFFLGLLCPILNYFFCYILNIPITFPNTELLYRLCLTHLCRPSMQHRPWQTAST